MQPQTATRPRTRKSQPAVVRLVDRNAGLYRVLSSNGVDWYRVNAVEMTCTCTGFIDYGKVCRHIRASVGTMEMHRSLRLGRQQMVHLSGAQAVPAAPVSPRATLRHCARCGADYFGVLAEGWHTCSAQQPIAITRSRNGASALLDAFGA